ncbi:DUF5368 domain-containing protein [Xanthobacter sp. AM11]|uniref:DUF5368 domain-containing protein n=1 Tax=Xanthobacter sp. AM11 TaxID=3380643 RepID=UPI0039BF23F9
MKDLDPAVFAAVFQEILGPFFWPLVALVVLGAAAFVFVLIRDGKLVSARFLWSELIGLLGGVFAIWFTFAITSSDLADIGGPIDWVLLIALFAAGSVGGAIIAYVLLSLLRRRPAAG